MNPKQLRAWAAANGYSVKGPIVKRGDGIGASWFEVAQDGAPVATIMVGKDGQFGGEAILDLYVRTGRPKDLPGIGRIPVSEQEAGTLLSGLGMQVTTLKVEEDFAEPPGPDKFYTEVKTRDGMVIANLRGAIETELLRNLTGRCLSALRKEDRLRATTAREMFKSALAKAEAANAARPSTLIGIPTEYLDVDEIEAEAFAMDMGIASGKAIQMDAAQRYGKIERLEQLVGQAEAEKNGIFVNVTEYHERDTQATGDPGRLCRVYSACNSNPLAGGEDVLTVRVFEHATQTVDPGGPHRDLNRRYSVSYKSVRDAALVVKLSDSRNGTRSAAECLAELVKTAADRARYTEFMRDRGEPMRPFEGEPDKVPNEG